MENPIAESRPSTPQERAVFTFLNELRDSGETNMFAAAPYIEAEFPGTTLREANYLLALWMKNFNEEGNYETITITKNK